MLEQVPCAVASVNGGKAAWDAILKGAKVEPRKGSIDGKAQLFGDVFKNIIGALESREDLAMGKDETSGIHLIRRPGLRGWDFVDMVNWKYLFGRKEVKIDQKTAGEWDLVAAEKPDLVVLFCKGPGRGWLQDAWKSSDRKPVLVYLVQRMEEDLEDARIVL